MGRKRDGSVRELSNWGNYPRAEAEVMTFSGGEEAASLLREGPSLIPRGLGRCYGDSALAPRVLSTQRHGRLLTLDQERGEVVCEAGMSIGELLEILLPLGWFLPVVPGTKHVTVGGAIASDIHGKNHHKVGTFSRHVLWMELLTASGELLHLTPEESPRLFRATSGGMGLTGIILKAGLRLHPVQTSFIRNETLVARDLNVAMGLFQESEDWSYTVAWIDCQARGRKLGRSILFRGEHALATDLPASLATDPLRLKPGRSLSIPFNLPTWTLNPLSVKAFNLAYFRKQAWGAGESLVDYSSFFFPLDGVLEWNRIYGRRGFLQYQFVLPLQESEEGVACVLERIARSGLGSFLAVLKLMGEGEGMLSFPLKGYTLALDFPASPRAFALVEELDALVLRFGGRLYLTKDARMPRTMLDGGYPDVEAFRALRREADPGGLLASLQSKRLDL